MSKHDSPIRRDTVALVGVLLQTLEEHPAYRALIDRLCRRGLDLLESVMLALSGIDREERLIDADAALQSVRCMLRMARDLDVLDDDELLGFIEQSDRVGRHIGGWLGQLSGHRGGHP